MRDSQYAQVSSASGVVTVVDMLTVTGTIEESLASVEYRSSLRVKDVFYVLAHRVKSSTPLKKYLTHGLRQIIRGAVQPTVVKTSAGERSDMLNTKRGPCLDAVQIVL